MKDMSKILRKKYLKSTILGLSTSILISFPAYSETFSEAFSKARSNGLTEFMYNGNMYSTQTKEEKESLNYGPFPVTLKNYSGSKTNSVAYTGQIARHVLHDSLKKISAKGNGNSNPLLYLDMSSYFYGSDDNLKIIAPASKEGFPIKQTMLNEISKGKNLSGKIYKGVVTGWPNQMTGAEVVDFWMKKASESNGGFDASTGYNYTQLISKFIMGAVFYHQAVDNYLDEKLSAEKKPNSKPYKDGAYYTGKEHSWDEAFGYWGVAAHGLNHSAKDNYNITKMKDLSVADYNKDGVVDLKSEMTFAHAYYASSFDKSGKTDYLRNVTKAFIDGRSIIASAKGENLSDSQRNKLYALAKVIHENWQAVIAESVFKYAGSVYKDISKMEELIESGGDTTKAFKTYAKHWGELKGFSLALQTGKNNLGETAAYLNREVGFGPILLNSSQVTGIDSKGNYLKDEAITWGQYKLNMIKIQKLMIEKFNVKARGNDQTDKMAALAEKLGDLTSAEND